MNDKDNFILTGLNTFIILSQKDKYVFSLNFKAKMSPSDVCVSAFKSNLPLTIVSNVCEQTACKSYKPALHEASCSL